MSARPSLPEPSDAPPARVTDRLGEWVSAAGFQPLPDVLLFHQHDLGIRSEDLNVLLQVMAHWYRADQMPFPRATTIAKRMGVSARTVQRSIARLRKLGFLGKTHNQDGRAAHDLAPLITKLEPYAKRRLATRRELQAAA